MKKRIPVTNTRSTPAALARVLGFGLRHAFVIPVSLLVISPLLFSSAVFAQAGNPDRLRAERVGWARLKTEGDLWMRHSESDPKLMLFFRQHTTLNIDPTWYAADVEKLDEMCAYPLLFAQDLQPVRSDRGLRNLAEYLRRGGFLLIDACINPHWRGEPDEFVEKQRRVLMQSIPEARLVPVPGNHEIFRVFFGFPDGPPHTAVEPGWDDPCLYGIYIGGRMAGIISRSGLQCGWAGMRRTPQHDVQSMEMLVNIYIYVMMQGGER